MKKVKIGLIIVLILSISLTIVYYFGGYKILAPKSNISVEYASEETPPTNVQDGSTSSEITEEELNTIQGYVQIIYTIETTENLKEGWILVEIEGTLYNAYRSFQYFNENNELLSYTPEISNFPPAFIDNNGNIYCLGAIAFNTEEDSSIAKYWANEDTYIVIYPLNLIKNPPQEILYPEGETTE